MPSPGKSEQSVEQESRHVRYGDFVAACNVHQSSVSYNQLIPSLETDASGVALPYEPPPIRLNARDVWRLLAPYTGARLWEQIRTVVPLALALVGFQILVLQSSVQEPWIIGLGVLAVVFGLMMFMEGLKQGLMPFGENLGAELPERSSLPVVLCVTMVLGVGVTFAEPAIGALRAAGSIVSAERAPYLWSILTQWPETLVLLVGVGVGAAAVLGTLRFLYNWSLKPLIYGSVIPTVILTAFVMGNPDLVDVIGLAWDCGAVTTGPVTVPLVLALGIGVVRAAGKGESSLSGFGIVTLASLFPIVAVLLLALYVSQSSTPEEILAAAKMYDAQVGSRSIWDRTPLSEITAGVRAIVPLVIFLFVVLRGLLKQPVRNPGITVYGLVLCLVGMCVFNIGLSYGLSRLGQQSGSIIPAAFLSIEAVAGSPLYQYALGVVIAVLFAWVLGFGATFAEPALNALGMTVETLTNGAFRKALLVYAVSLGVGFGIALGILRILFDWPLGYLLLPGYALALLLTAVSDEEFVNVAWDSAGVTTGPVTVPLVLALGLGFGNATAAVEGFGILSMASIGPIVSVLGVGLWLKRVRIRRQVKRRLEATVGE